MRKDQQDLAFACLPKETRIAMRRDYAASTNSKRDIGFNSALSLYFGHHNLTSDTEPEEVLLVKKETITNIYEANERIIDSPQWAESIKDKAHHVNSLFETIFGDKCLPDKEQPKPKLRVNDTVVFNNNICRIIGTDYENNEYQIERISDNNLMGWVNRQVLEPYTKENKETMEEKELNSWDEDFKRMNELFNKMQKTVAKIYDSYGKMCVAVDKLKRL